MGISYRGFNRDVWGVSMIGDFEETPPTDIQLRTVGRLLGWRLGPDHLNPAGTSSLVSAGSQYTIYPAGSRVTLPTIFAHRDVGNTGMPRQCGIRGAAGDSGYGGAVQPLTGHRRLAARGAIFAKWEAMGGKDGPLGTHVTGGRS